MGESLSAMWAGGGERAEDLAQFRQDRAVALRLGHELPAAQTARDFLVQFHAEDLPLLQDEGASRRRAGATVDTGGEFSGSAVISAAACVRQAESARESGFWRDVSP